MSVSGIKRPALRYYGGKWRIARKIICHFPPHVCYVEPYGGGASVLLRKPPSPVEVYNDKDGGVVNFFRVLREQPEELLRLVSLTPFSRAEFLQAQKPSDDPLEAARRFYVWSWQGWGRAGVKEPGGWRFLKGISRVPGMVHDWNNCAHLWAIAWRLKAVQIECGEALDVIARYDTPETLYYCDPPYPHAVRGKRWAHRAYACEMVSEGEDKEGAHRALAEALHEIEGMAIVSGMRCDLYDGLYEGWDQVEVTNHTWGNGRVGGKSVTESLWLSPRASEALQAGRLC